MALCAAGGELRNAHLWLSDEPPPSYQSACAALSSRLKEAEQACAAGLFANIHKAAQDPRYWTAAAWTLERKHGYVAQQQQLNGPATVVNIGTLNVVQGERPRISWRDDPALDVVAVSSTSDK
jgi:Tfp pilus assembly protein PilX